MLHIIFSDNIFWYYVSNATVPSYLDVDLVYKALEFAFNRWSSATSARFKNGAMHAKPDIFIGFYAGSLIKCETFVKEYLIWEKMSEFYLLGVLICRGKSSSPGGIFVTFHRPNLQFSHFYPTKLSK